jgi:YVTN family beta-propeller protein
MPTWSFLLIGVIIVLSGPASVERAPPAGVGPWAASGTAVGAFGVLPGAFAAVVPEATVPVGNNPLAVAFDGANGDVYVANENTSGDHGSVTVISGSTDAVIATITVGARPSELAVDSGNGEVYVLNSYSQNASVINGTNNTLAATIPIPCVALEALAVDPVNHDVYAGCTEGAGLYAISDASNTIAATIGGAAGWATAVDTTSGDVYSEGNESQTHNMSVIDEATNTILKTIQIGDHCNGCDSMAFDPANGDVYLTAAGNVSIVSSATNSVVATIQGVAGPFDAFDSSNGDLYVANYGSSNVTVISGSTNTTVANIEVGLDPTSLYIDPVGGDVYVVNSGSDNVSVISGSTNTVIATLPVGSDPGAVALDLATGQVFVTNSGSANVSVISNPAGSGGHASGQARPFGLSNLDIGLLLGGAGVVLVAVVAVFVRGRTRHH